MSYLTASPFAQTILRSQKRPSLNICLTSLHSDELPSLRLITSVPPNLAVSGSSDSGIPHTWSSCLSTLARSTPPPTKTVGTARRLRTDTLSAPSLTILDADLSWRSVL